MGETSLGKEVSPKAPFKKFYIPLAFRLPGQEDEMPETHRSFWKGVRGGPALRGVTKRFSPSYFLESASVSGGFCAERLAFTQGEVWGTPGCRWHMALYENYYPRRDDHGGHEPHPPFRLELGECGL